MGLGAPARRRSPLRSCLLVVSLLFAAVHSLLHAGNGLAQQTSLPDGFRDELVAAVETPTALAFTPDGRLLVASKTGRLWVYAAGEAQKNPPTLALDISDRICADAERGLIGVAVDPNFTETGFIYLYYTLNKYNDCGSLTATTPVNRIARFQMTDNELSAANELVLLDNIPTPHGFHNAGDLEFGPDGYLYIAVGDGECDPDALKDCAANNSVAQRNSVLNGKILRITADGGIPPDNPYAATGDRCATNGRTDPGRDCQEVYASGLRNPFRFAFDPNPAGDGRFFINDVGQNQWEEINLGAAGANYGWNAREGLCETGARTGCGHGPDRFTDPLYAYSHESGCTAITAAAFVPDGVWPDAYQGGYLFGDYTCGQIFLRSSSGNVSVFDPEAGAVIAMTFGPTEHGQQALYFAHFLDLEHGEIHRLEYAAGDLPDVLGATANPTNGALPLTVAFRGGEAPDPAAQYTWNFGDGSPQATGFEASYTYESRGVYMATLTVTNADGDADETTFRIDPGNTVPAPTIMDASTAGFRVGEQITLHGSAHDDQDGWLPAENMSWQVILHHDTHTHPFVPPTPGDQITFTVPAPEDLLAATNSYLEVQLTATDASGLAYTVSQDLMPQKVKLSFITDPVGLNVLIDGAEIPAPATITAWAGDTLDVGVADQVDPDGRIQEFLGWSDAATGNDGLRQIGVDGTPRTFVARFRTGSLSFVPVADARVAAGDPELNLGNDGALTARDSETAATASYIRFDVSGVAGTIQRATVWVYVYTGSKDGPAVYACPDTTWREDQITWANRPPPTGPELDNAGAMVKGTWVALDVTAAVAGDGVYTFALIADSRDGATMLSREEGITGPHLVIDTIANDGTGSAPPTDDGTLVEP